MKVCAHSWDLGTYYRESITKKMFVHLKINHKISLWPVKVNTGLYFFQLDSKFLNLFHIYYELKIFLLVFFAIK
jgi:hypothetical protein